MDGIINFNALTDDNIKTIIGLEMDKSVKRFKDIGYELSYNKEEVIDFIYDKMKDEKDYGARPIIRKIQNEIEGPVTDAILDCKVSKNICIKLTDNKLELV